MGRPEERQQESEDLSLDPEIVRDLELDELAADQVQGGYKSGYMRGVNCLPTLATCS